MSEIIDDVNEVETTTFAKGLNLEKEFCEFLKTDLGWTDARIRAQMSAANNMRGTQVDVLAERLNEKGQFAKKLAYIYIPIFLFTFILGITINSDALMIMGLLFELAGGIALILSITLNKEHAWIECKNRKTKTDIRQMQLTISQVDEYKKSGNKKYKFTEIYFVSSSGFVENALKLAEENNVKCYYKKDGNFFQAKFWEHY